MKVEKGKFYDIGKRANRKEKAKLPEVKKEWKQVEGPKK